MAKKRTTFEHAFMNRLTLRTTTKLEIISKLEPDTAVLEKLRSERTPIASVTIRELVQLADAPPASLARGTAIGKLTYRDVMTMPLHDLRDVGRVDVIRIGRHPEQDVQALDIIVSREHGLVIFDVMPFYFDYGTLIEDADDERGPGRSGSRNGSYLNGETLIQNGMVPWLEQDTIRFGSGSGPHYAFELAVRLMTPPVEN